ncbi:T1SS-143 domain-containing protein, partial [Metapseudomonas resinovorans]|uniref:beta strand repeat-containing protein n=1 Tax=Metapseudomonas resinovorans TaxID=53412 RepID=UPI003D1A8BFB
TFIPSTQTGTYGSLVLGGNGVWTYSLDNAASQVQALTEGETKTETFTVQAADGTEHVITVSVVGTNEAAVLGIANVQLTETDVPLTTGGTLSISDVDSPATFVAQTGTVGNYGSFSIDVAGAWTYTANSAFNQLNVGDSRTDTFEVVSADGTKTSVTVTINGSNDAPRTSPEHAIGNEDTVISVDLHGTDVDGTVASFTLTSLPANGTFYSDAAATNPLTLSSVIAATSNGATIYFKPNADWSGTTNFKYVAIDNSGLADPNPVNGNITVHAVNDPTVVAPDTQSVAEDNLATGNVLTNDSDVDNPLTVASFSVAGVTGSFTAGASATIANVGTFTLGSNGDYTFTPAANWSGDVPTVTYIVNNGQGGSQSTLNLRITPVADTPNLALAGSNPLPADTGLVIQTWNNLNLGTNGDGANPATLQTTIDQAGTPSSSGPISNVNNGSVTAGIASKISGLIYLEANQVYTFSGVGDDSIRVVVGGTSVGEATWGTTGGVFSGNFKPSVSGYYTLDIYHHNQSGPGNFDVNLAVNGGPARDLSTANAELYRGTADLAAEGVRLSALQGSNGKGYYEGYSLNEGDEDSWIPLSAITASLVDTDGSEALTLQIGNIPEGAILTDGIRQFTATSALNSQDVTQWNLSTLSIKPPQDFNGTFTLDVKAIATESDGTSATKNLPLVVEVHPVADAPVIQQATATVSEEGLVDGIADTTGISDTTNSASTSGTVQISQAEGIPISSVVLTSPTGTFTSGGQAITWSGSGTQTLTGVAGGKVMAILTINNAGQYSFDLKGPIDHVGDANNEGTLSLDFGVHATAAGQSSQGTLTVTVEDDSPIQGNPRVDSVTTLDSNLLIVLDTSGSMGTADGVNGTTRLASAKAAIKTLLDRYDDAGDVKVRIVTFSDDGTERQSTWVSVATAKTILDSITTPSGGTNYAAALDTARDAFTDSGKISGAQNVAYFFSDGAPSSGDGITSSRETTWKNFLEANQVKSYAIGIGTGITNQTPLDPIAYDGQSLQDMNGTLVSNFNQLEEMLASTVISQTSGNLFTGGSLGDGLHMGADGGFIRSVTSEGTTYTFNPSGNSLSVSGTNRAVYDSATKQLTITTTTGGKLRLDLLNGDYTYDAPSGVTSASAGTSFSYQVQDWDGDQASSSVSVNVDRLVPLISDGQTTFNGTTGSDLMIARPAGSLVGTVASGDPSGNNNAIQFSFVDGADGISITRIVIDLQAGSDSNAVFDTVRNGSGNGNSAYAPTLGNLVGLNTSDVSFAVVDDTSSLTINLTSGSFTKGDVLRFGVDVDNLGDNHGADFASRGVTYTVTFSDGTTQTVTYGSDGNNGAIGTTKLNSGVTILGGDGNDMLIGSQSGDNLFGGNGNDYLFGGKGHDQLTGGAGADSFVWRAGDTGNDVIKDFNAAHGDRIDISDLLPDAANSNNILDYLKVDTATSTLQVSTTGNVANSADVTIKLEGVNLSDYGSSSSQIVNSLIAGADPLVKTEHN